MIISPTQRKAARKLWRPKRPEVPEQCASCPFRVGNDTEFAKIVRILRQQSGIVGGITKAIVRFARMSIRMDVSAQGGDLACHYSAYDLQTGKTRPSQDWKQCKGASEFYREGN